MTDTKASDRADRVRELQSQLEHQVADLVSGDDWARMLETASKFHRYSANNVMLIMLQRPDATRVAGYRAWQALGRQVRKGERGITILAPCKYRRTWTDDDGTEQTAIGIRGFTTTTVFDIAQTDGADLPDVRPQLVEGGAPAGLWDGLAKQIAAAGFMLARCDSAQDIGGANGVTNYATRTVTVRSDVDDAQAVKTLAHELAHVMLHDRSGLAWSLCMEPGSRRIAEIEAESVAYVVCAAMGLPTDGYSLPYVAGWSGGDVAKVRETAERVVKAAGAILEGLEGHNGADVAA